MLSQGQGHYWADETIWQTLRNLRLHGKVIQKLSFLFFPEKGLSLIRIVFYENHFESYLDAELENFEILSIRRMTSF